MFTVKEKVYADENGKTSHEPGKGRKLILERGAVISDEQAKELGLRALGKELDKAAVEAAREQNGVLAPVLKEKPKADPAKPEAKEESSASAFPAIKTNGGN